MCEKSVQLIQMNFLTKKRSDINLKSKVEGGRNKNSSFTWNKYPYLFSRVIFVKIDLQIYVTSIFLACILASTPPATLLIFRVACASRAHTTPKLWSWKIAAGNVFYFRKYLLSDATDFHTAHLPRNIPAPGGQKNFFFFPVRTWRRSRTLVSTERQKGVRDRHENDPRRVHPPADLCYHMVLRYHRPEREIDVENISPFNTSLFAPSFSFSPLFFALLVWCRGYKYIRGYALRSRHFTHVLFSLCTPRHEKGLMPCSRQLLAKNLTR